MKRVFIAAIFIALLCGVGAAQQGEDKIAILGISGTDEAKTPVILDILVRTLGQSGKIGVISPFFVERAMTRYNSSLKSIWGPDDACRIGAHLRASKVVCLRYVFAKKDVMFKSVVYQVESRATVLEDSISGDAREFCRLVYQLATRVHRKLTGSWVLSNSLPATSSEVPKSALAGTYFDVPDLLATTDPSISIMLRPDGGDGVVVKQGERLKFSFWVESREHNGKPCFITLLDVSPSGRVSMLFPNVSAREAKITIGQGYSFPATLASFDFAAGCEAGEELVVAIASRGGLQFINRYLYDARHALLPLIEPSFNGLVRDRILPEFAKRKTGIAVTTARYVVDF